MMKAILKVLFLIGIENYTSSFSDNSQLDYSSEDIPWIAIVFMVLFGICFIIFFIKIVISWCHCRSERNDEQNTYNRNLLGNEQENVIQQCNNNGVPEVYPNAYVPQNNVYYGGYLPNQNYYQNYPSNQNNKQQPQFPQQQVQQPQFQNQLPPNPYQQMNPANAYHNQNEEKV